MMKIVILHIKSNQNNHKKYRDHTKWLSNQTNILQTNISLDYRTVIMWPGLIVWHRPLYTIQEP